jgi:hypothetical protein
MLVYWYLRPTATVAELGPIQSRPTLNWGAPSWAKAAGVPSATNSRQKVLSTPTTPTPHVYHLRAARPRSHPTLPLAPPITLPDSILCDRAHFTSNVTSLACPRFSPDAAPAMIIRRPSS